MTSMVFVAEGLKRDRRSECDLQTVGGLGSALHTKFFDVHRTIYYLEHPAPLLVYMVRHTVVVAHCLILIDLDLGSLSYHLSSF